MLSVMTTKPRVLSSSSRLMVLINSRLTPSKPFLSVQEWGTPRIIPVGSSVKPSVALEMVASTAVTSSLVVPVSPSHSTGVPIEIISVSSFWTCQTAAWTTSSVKMRAKNCSGAGCLSPLSLPKKLPSSIDTAYSKRQTAYS